MQHQQGCGFCQRLLFSTQFALQPIVFDLASSRNAALASRDSGAVALQNASPQAFSWCSNNPFSRHHACSCVSGMACVWFSASKRWAGLHDGAGKSSSSCAAGPPTSCFWLDLLIHFLKVPTGIFKSSATSWTLRVPRCLALLRACSWNSVECRFVVMNSAPMRIIRNQGSGN